MIRKGYADVGDGKQVHYRRVFPEVFSGTVVLLHQRPSSSRMWEPIMPLLAGHGLDTVAFDLPGHGESFLPKESMLESFAASISGSISQLELRQPIMVTGHHLGAAVAMQMAVDFPNQVNKLALYGVPILDHLDEGLKNKVPKPPDFEDDDLQNVISFWKIRNRFTTKPGYVMPPSTRAARLIEMLQSSSDVSELIFRMDVNHLVKLITQPTLCMCGEHEMLLDATVHTSKELQNGKLCLIPNAGLDVQDEYPEEFTNALVEFLAE